MKPNYISILITIVIIIIILYIITKQIRETHSQNDPVLKEINKIFTEFFNKDRYWNYPLDKLNNNNIMDKVILYRGKKSYTINKRKIYLCLKDEEGSYYTLNMLVYVMAHEISHAICDEIGHTEKFHRIFEALLEELIKDGLYNPNIPVNSKYCELGDGEFF